MAIYAKNGIRVDGLKDLQQALREAPKEVRKEVRAANKLAAEVVASAAKTLAPSRTGRLAASIGARAGQKDASVKAGSAARVPYAGPIHFGWHTRPNPEKGWRGGPIRPQPFLYDALDLRREAVLQRYVEAMSKIATDLSTN